MDLQIEKNEKNDFFNYEIHSEKNLSRFLDKEKLAYSKWDEHNKSFLYAMNLEKFIYSKRYQKLHGKHFGSNNLSQAHYVDFDLENLIII